MTYTPLKQQDTDQIGSAAAKVLLEWAARHELTWIQLNQCIEVAQKQVAVDSLEAAPGAVVSVPKTIRRGR